MLSDNIRYYRKKMNLSQDELGEKLGVSRQSVSFWETGQTQPTIENVIALGKLFNISTDALLGNFDENASLPTEPTADIKSHSKSRAWLILIICISIIAIIITAIWIYFKKNKGINTDIPNNSEQSGIYIPEINQSTTINTETTTEQVTTTASSTPETEAPATNAPETNPPTTSTKATEDEIVIEDHVADEEPFDLFSYCRDFAIEKGLLYGDYCMYQQPSSIYGGYDNEYFSISYWADSNMVEFCLHCPLSETYSHNFYLRMRGGYNNEYEYLSSKYFRSTGVSLRCAWGYIDPAVFSDSYPISCDSYEGSSDGQNEFMEQTRIGICDLIKCLKEFVYIEGMECDFSDFDFVNF